jgi:LysM repeat protein
MKRIPSIVVVVTLVAVASFIAVPRTAEAAPLANDPGCTQFYFVRFGDRLVRIAQRFGTTVRALTARNGLANPNRILAGQRLCVRGTLPAPGAGFFHIVRIGDTLSALGRRFGWKVSLLARVNHIANPNRIFVGQVLFIPNH